MTVGGTCNISLTVPLVELQIAVPPTTFFHCENCGAELAWELQIVRTPKQVKMDRLKERIFGERWMTMIRPT
jgi:hypothetical protein